MNRPVRSRTFACLIAVISFVLLHGADKSIKDEPPLNVSKLVKEDAKGRLVVKYQPLERRYRNPPLPAGLEEAWLDRADAYLRWQARQPLRVNTYFENEKGGYGVAMAQVLAGSRKALEKLQERDHQHAVWHRETDGIDWYACFTIKHQIRKYFFFGDLLEPGYKKLMAGGGKKWTAKDPLRRPHYAYKKGGPGWGPDVKNSWVDVRSTDNLSMMRNVAVYLMAEETGNEAVRRIYKKRFTTYVISLYHIGMGEWDSENYMGHTLAPVYSIHDFARDPEMKLLAKACLDWLHAAGAWKYWRGGFNMPNKRDYNKVAPLHGSAAGMFRGSFGQVAGGRDHWDYDLTHLFTSSYRPPLAVMNLAHKQFRKPVEMFSSKAEYGAPQKGELDKAPEFHETDYVADTYMLGTVSRGTDDRSDVGAFKIQVFNSKKGVDYIQLMPGVDVRFPGSAQYQSGKVEGPNRIGQHRNLAIHLVRKGDAAWFWLMPKTIAVEGEGGVTFFKAEKTWMAWHPINLVIKGIDAGMTEAANWKEKKKKVKGQYTMVKSPLWPDCHAVSAKGKGGAYCGVAVEIGEAGTHGSYSAFKKAVLRKSKVDADGIENGVAELTGCQGHSVKVKFGDAMPAGIELWRDGKPHDWSKHRVLYQAADGAASPIRLPWNGDGTLHVEAGGAVFTCTVTREGKVTFESR